jgi:hypothetical protein
MTCWRTPSRSSQSIALRQGDEVIITLLRDPREPSYWLYLTYMYNDFPSVVNGQSEVVPPLAPPPELPWPEAFETTPWLGEQLP